MLASISSRMLTEWMAYFELDPFGYERSDNQAAQITAAMINMWRAKGESPVSIEDVRLKYDRASETAATDEDMRGEFRAFLGAVRNRNHGDHNRTSQDDSEPQQ